MGLDPVHVSCAKEFATLSGFLSFTRRFHEAACFGPHPSKSDRKSRNSFRPHETAFNGRNETIHLTAWDACVAVHSSKSMDQWDERILNAEITLVAIPLRTRMDKAILTLQDGQRFIKNLPLRSRPVFLRCFQTVSVNYNHISILTVLIGSAQASLPVQYP